MLYTTCGEIFCCALYGTNLLFKWLRGSQTVDYRTER